MLLILSPEKVAVKMLDKGKLDHKTQKLLSREIEAMEEVHHPSILRLYEVIETLSTQYFVMEYAAGKLISVAGFSDSGFYLSPSNTG